MTNRPTARLVCPHCTFAWEAPATAEDVHDVVDVAHQALRTRAAAAAAVHAILPTDHRAVAVRVIRNARIPDEVLADVGNRVAELLLAPGEVAIVLGCPSCGKDIPLQQPKNAVEKPEDLTVAQRARRAHEAARVIVDHVVPQIFRRRAVGELEKLARDVEAMAAAGAAVLAVLVQDEAFRDALKLLEQDEGVNPST